MLWQKKKKRKKATKPKAVTWLHLSTGGRDSAND